jgi:uncharacterized membrane protein YsdA (DUF1294 family)
MDIFMKSPAHKPKQFYMWVSIIGIVTITTLIYYMAGPVSPYNILLTGAGIVTFLLYGFDKMQAKRDGGRVPEIILHLLVLAGGFIGGWAGRIVFRHKTRKPVFLVVLILATVSHCLYALWW